MRSKTLIVAVAVALVIGAGVASATFASIPDGAGVVTGCFRPTTGQPRVINADSNGCAPASAPGMQKSTADRAGTANNNQHS